MSHGHDDDTMIDATLDTAIDDVAHEMPSLPARADLAARVTAHIEAEAASPRRRWSFIWVMSPVAVALVLILAVVVERETRRPATPLRSEPVRPEAIVPAQDTPPVTIPAAADDAPRIQARAPRSAAAAQPPAFDVTPLEIPSIQLGSLSVSPIARGEAIEIEPIVIDRIEITAMP